MYWDGRLTSQRKQPETLWKFGIPSQPTPRAVPSEEKSAPRFLRISEHGPELDFHDRGIGKKAK